MSSSLTINPNLPASRSAPTSPSTSAPASPKKSSSSPLSEWTQKLLEIRQESTEADKKRKWELFQSAFEKQEFDETCSTNSEFSDLSDSLDPLDLLDQEKIQSSSKKVSYAAKEILDTESKIDKETLSIVQWGGGGIHFSDQIEQTIKELKTKNWK